MTKKRITISSKTINNNEEDIDSLFKPKIKNEDKLEKNINKEKELHHFEPIKNYYLNHEFKKQKQYSIYLPTEIQKALKQKATLEDKSISELLIKEIINNILSKEDIMSAYRRGFEERNS